MKIVKQIITLHFYKIEKQLFEIVIIHNITVLLYLKSNKSSIVNIWDSFKEYLFWSFSLSIIITYGIAFNASQT